MNISEIFYTIQGEGQYLGYPSIFVRTSGCNIRCEWCDTPYTSWDPEKNIIDVHDVMDKVEELIPIDFLPHVVITGGEPYLQNDLPEFVNLLKQRQLFVTIETNGTIFIPTKVDFLSISPKLSTSAPRNEKWVAIHNEKRLNFEALKSMMNSCEFQLKFVVDTPSDFKEIDTIVESLGSDVRKFVILMPQGRRKHELSQKYKIIADHCLKKGYRMTPRLHVDIWGDVRGR